MTARHLLTFAGCTIAVDAVGRAADSITTFVLAGIETQESGTPRLTFTVTPAGTADRLRLMCGDAVLNEDDTPHAIGAHLACALAQVFADQVDDGLVLHAAAAAWGAVGLVMPGQSGAGKTTLCAHLVHQGAAYLSDELVYLSASRAVVEGFARPLSLKPGAWPRLERDLEGASDAPDVLAIVDGFLIRAERLNPETARSRPALRVLVFPRRVQGAAATVRRLTKAEAGLALLANLVNARNLPDHGLAQVTQITRDVPAWEAVYDDASEVGPRLRALVVDEALPPNQNSRRSSAG